MTLRSVHELGAGDVVVGQVWRDVTTDPRWRLRWRVIDVDRLGDIRMVCVDDPTLTPRIVPVGGLLAYWVLTAEAET